MLVIVHTDENNSFLIRGYEQPKLETTFIVIRNGIHYSYTIVEILEIIENKKYEIWVKEYCWG